jgi:UDP-glucuronate decarboxylase
MQLDDGRVVSNFIVQALKNKNITIYGDGNQTRSFCFVDDLISAFILFMNSEEDLTGPINIGNPKEFTIEELALIIIKLTKSKSKIINKPLPLDDPIRRQPDITEIKKRLGWEPKIELEEGLIKTIDYFKKII